MFTKKSDIIFIGAGKVAHTLIPLLIEKNYCVKGIVNRSLKSALSLAKNCRIDFYSNDLSKIPSSSGVFILTVPDNEISKVAEQLSKLKLKFRDSLFFHTSGSEDSDALKCLEEKGGIIASFHIMQTFPSLKKANIRKSFAAIETGSLRAEKFLFSLARSLELKSFKLSKEKKLYYHLAGVFVANFLNANFFSSEKLLLQSGLNNKIHYKLFEPIISSTLINIKTTGVENSLSGPIQRGDYKTVIKHIKAIKHLKTKENKILHQSYISQSLILLEIVKKKKKKLSPDQQEIKRILKKEFKL